MPIQISPGDTPVNVPAKKEQPAGLNEFNKRVLVEMRVIILGWTFLQNNQNRMSPAVQQVFNGLLRSAMDHSSEVNLETLEQAIADLVG